MSFEISFTNALMLKPKFASTLKALIGNKEKLSEMARTPMNEHYSAVILNKLPKKLRDPGKFLIPCEFPGMDECLALADLGASINLMPLSMWKGLSLPELTLTYMTLELADRTESNQSVLLKIDFLLFEEADAFLGLEDDLDSPELDPSYYDPEGDILSLEVILNSDPSPPLPNHEQFMPSFKEELKACEAKTIKSSIDEPPEVDLKDLPPHLEYVFVEGDNKFPIIIAKALKDEEKSALIKVLKSHKRAIAWKLSDIQGINLEKLLDAGLIYPISDSPWVSPVHCVPKKGGFTVVANEENELIPTRLVTGWRTMEVFIDDFSVFRNSFENCISRLDKMLQRCEDTKLCLNWEKSHFMVKEGIVLGHKISKNGIEVDKAKIDVIAKLPHPTTVK
nr:DNA-directed DNA polymerase [Tanacetum cinerariifolium]